MCGFGGIINSIEGITTNRLQRIADEISFRGPDSCGIKIMNNSLEKVEIGAHALFFNRLAIMDLDPRSDQPFENDRFLLTFNGEIYNYQEIKTELQKKQYNFHTTSDTEVLFYALEEWGTGALERLNGMFAFFWLDKKERKIIVARDRLGIKPLYYYADNSTLVFASELYSIISLMNKEITISQEAVDMYLWMQFVPTPFTIINGINKLPPGCFLEGKIDHIGEIRISEYWNAYDHVTSKKNDPDTTLEQVLTNSLKRQLHADVPLGLFLSSGVDSSLLAALANKHFADGKHVNFFTVQFDEQTASDESNDARNYISGFNNPNLHCNTITISPASIKEKLTRLYDYYDEPFADPASLLNWTISQKARDYVTVAISGDGADELFWGYDRYNRWEKFTSINNIPILSNLGRISTRLPFSSLSDNAKFVMEKDPIKRHFNFFLPSGMRSKIRKHITQHNMWALKGVDKIKMRPDLPAILDIKTYLADAMLYKVDRSSMASSLEVRVPYLDNKVLEYALQMTLQQKSNNKFNNKAPLKQLLQNLAPHYDTTKPKKGFSFPLKTWLKEHWKDQVLETVTRDKLILAGLEPKPYLQLINDFYSSRNNYFTDVWYIFNLMLWMEKNQKSILLKK